MKKTTVIFDLDGTLLDTLEDLYQSVSYTQQKLGYPLHSRSQVRAHVGNGIRVLMEKSLPADASPQEIEKAFRMCQTYYGEHSQDATKPYEGIMELLDQLNQTGYKLAIVSNKPDFAVKELNQIFFSDYITVAIGEQESAGIRKKPAPDTVFEALKLLQSSVEESIYVGDSEVDIKTADHAGMDVILCEWGFREKEDLIRQGAKVFADKPKTIFEIINNN